MPSGDKMDRRPPRRSSSIDSSRRGKALLVTWEDATSSEGIEAAAVHLALEQCFGYEVVSLSLGHRGPDTALLDKIHSLLDEYGSALNPFFLYYCGKAFIMHGSPFWAASASEDSAAVDWLEIQKALESYKPDIILALDCDYGNMTIANRDIEALTFRRVSPRKDYPQFGKLEIIATLHKAPSSQQPFGRTMAGIFEARRNSSLSVESLLSDLQKKLGDLVIYENLSPESNYGMIEMIPMCPLPRISDMTKSDGTFYNEQDRDLISMVRKWNESSQWAIRSPNQEGNYRKVVVQPIIWRVSDWEAREETELLRATFMKHFDYQVEEIFVIQESINGQSLNVQQSLETKFQSFIGENSDTCLSENDLLIVIYNGHGMDGARSGCNMVWESGGKRAKQSINWTKIVRELDAAPCDVVQILDCCFGGNATKSKSHQEMNMLDHIHQETPASDYRGTNEILASCGRDTETPAGDYNSMKLFSDVLGSLASQKEPISIYSWFHEVDSEAVLRNTRTLQFIQRNPRKAGKWWHSPSWKCHPKQLWPKSIVLRPKSMDETPQSEGSSEPKYVYAKLKIEQGRPTNVTYYTQKSM